MVGNTRAKGSAVGMSVRMDVSMDVLWFRYDSRAGDTVKVEVWDDSGDTSVVDTLSTGQISELCEFLHSVVGVSK